MVKHTIGCTLIRSISDFYVSLALFTVFLSTENLFQIQFVIKLIASNFGTELKPAFVLANLKFAEICRSLIWFRLA